MNESRRNELREWSAGLMGWTEHFEIHGFTGRKRIYYTNEQGIRVGSKQGWTPDLPSAPASQILSVIERMRELGWFLSLDLSMVYPHEWTAQFFSEDEKFTLGTIADDPCLAILKAAWETGEGR